MKVLKIIGIVILALIGLVAVLGLIAPKSYEVERSIVIQAPKDLAFREMQFWKNFAAWAPWAEQDSSMKVTVLGVDGQKESKYVWQGDPQKTGSGEMTNTGVKANEEVTYHLHFITPWESHADGWFRVADANDGTNASWGFYGKNPFPMNILSLFMSMDKMLGPDFERGLTLLKERVEAKAAEITNLEIKQMKYPATVYAAIRKEMKLSDIKSFFESSYAAIAEAMESRGAAMAGAPVGVFFKWDEENGVADVAAGIPTRKRVATDDVHIINLPEASALYIDFYGPFEETELAHWALMKYCEKSGTVIRGPVLEEYLTDPASEPDPDKWLTRVIYLQ